MKSILVLIMFTMICATQLPSAESIKDKDYIIFYGNGSSSAIVKHVKKELKDVLKNRKIKIDEKGNKKYLIIDFELNLEKDVLKKKPQLVILAPGVGDFYDAKKKKARDSIDTTALFESLVKTVQRIQSAGIQVAIATPCIAGENTDAGHSIDTSLNEWSQKIRDLCKEHDISCCDFRASALKYLKSKNINKKEYGLLSKNGTKISKNGAEILAPALMKTLGMAKDGIGGPLQETDQIRFFLHGSFKYSTLAKNIDTLITEKFPNVAGPVKPSFKNIMIADITYAKEAPSKLIYTHQARVSFIYFGDRMRPVSRHRFEVFEKTITSLCADLKTHLNGRAYLLTLPSQAEAKDDKLHDLRKRMNDVIRGQAIENGLGVIDLYNLVESEIEKNPDFKTEASNGKTVMITPAYAKICEQEIIKILGLIQE